MRYLILLALLLPSCTSIHVTKTFPDGSKVDAFAGSLFATTAIKSLSIDSTRKSSSGLINASGFATDPDQEAITASANAIGQLIGAAARAAAK